MLAVSHHVYSRIDSTTLIWEMKPSCAWLCLTCIYSCLCWIQVGASEARSAGRAGLQVHALYLHYTLLRFVFFAHVKQTAGERPERQTALCISV